MNFKIIAELAGNAAASMEIRQREDGSEFTTRGPGAPSWMKDLCFAVHEGGLMFPDDYKYAFLSDALDALTETEDFGRSADVSDVCEYLREEYRTYHFTAWLASHSDRLGRTDEALRDFGAEGGILQAVSIAYRQEQEEVLFIVAEFLEDLADEDEEA